MHEVIQCEINKAWLGLGRVEVNDSKVEV